MKLGRVVGQITSTAKEQELVGFKLLLVCDVPATDPRAEVDYAGAYVAVDLVGAGRQEIVIVAEGGAARTLSRTVGVPTDAAVIAIVDNVGVLERSTYTNTA